MPRHLIRKITPHPDKLRDLWFFRMFGERLAARMERILVLGDGKLVEEG